MSKSEAPETTPAKGGEKDQERAEQVRRQRTLFFAMAVNMTWQMAMVVLVPILGGFYLDKLAGTSPVLLILGFLLAMAGTFIVMKRAFNLQNNMPDMPKKGGQK